MPTNRVVWTPSIWKGMLNSTEQSVGRTASTAGVMLDTCSNEVVAGLGENVPTASGRFSKSHRPVASSIELLFFFWLLFWIFFKKKKKRRNYRFAMPACKDASAGRR